MSAEGETVQIEVQAREMGWRPQEEFRGNPDNWVDAETYVERGKQVMPLLKANNKRLEDEVAALRTQTQETNALLQAAVETINVLKETNTTIALEKAKEKKKELVTAIREARTNGDVDAEFALEEQLEEHNAAIKIAEKSPKVAAQSIERPVDKAVKDPIFQGWLAENPWFTSDVRKAATANGYADWLRGQPEAKTLKPREFLDKVSAEVDRLYGGNEARSRAAAVGSSRPSSESSDSSSGASYNELPADAKEVCNRQAQKLKFGKGPGQFKDMADWRKHYAKTYFAS